MQKNEESACADDNKVVVSRNLPTSASTHVHTHIQSCRAIVSKKLRTSTGRCLLLETACRAWLPSQNVSFPKPSCFYLRPAEHKLASIAHAQFMYTRTHICTHAHRYEHFYTCTGMKTHIHEIDTYTHIRADVPFRNSKLTFFLQVMIISSQTFM
jgi:hypothetical protein